MNIDVILSQIRAIIQLLVKNNQRTLRDFVKQGEWSQ